MAHKTGAHSAFGVILQVSEERRRAVYEQIKGMSSPKASFWIMVGISTIIAAYGLLSNSTAVVIGAMLVAPLMGPIFGIALALLGGDRRLLGRAAVGEAAGVALAVALGVLIGLLPLRPEFGSEILSRTAPTIYDLMIAVASGLAGAYALIDERLSPTLPGVAMATAIVPPLATCGLALAAGRWNWAFGAFLLFFGNFLAIEIAAAVVFAGFRLAGAHTDQGVFSTRFVRRFGTSLIALLAVGVFMTQTLVTLVDHRRFETALHDILAAQVGSTLGAWISDVHVDRRNRAIDVLATVVTPQAFDPPQVAGMEAALRTRLNPHIHLVIRSVISQDDDANGPVFVPEEEQARQRERAAQTQFLTTASTTLKNALALVAGAQLVDIRRDEAQGQTTVQVVVRTPTAIAPAEVAAIELTLQQALGMPLHLVVRSVLTRDADARGYLYVTQEAPLAGEALVFHNRVQRGLQNQLKRVPGASLEEFRYERRDGRLDILATVRAPRMIEPGDVRRIEEAFRTYVDPATDLIVRVSVGADVFAAGFLADPPRTPARP
ncbi:MAG TPA: TIGR00341 family protein [bacterium]|nr:TIGR00341 family protein [bacterium]